MTSANTGGVLVSDFDGTMTRYDFYRLVVDELLPPDVPDFWEEFRSGHITHFEALRRYFAAIRSSEADVLAVVARMELDPQLPGAIAALRSAGWRVVVASAGCEWYIRRLIEHAGVDVEVHANPGRFEPGKGLLMEMPADSSPYRSSALGIDKSEVEKRPAEIAVEAANALNCVVALKGPETHIASPDGELYLYDGGDIGLATSGSGDTLAGVVTGLLARGASPLHSAVWGVFLHGAAGNALEKRLGRIGFLARELLDEIPPIMNAF